MGARIRALPTSVPRRPTLPSARTPMRSHTVCRLSRSCVIMKTVSPRFFCRVRISASNSPARIGSKLDVGSSRNTSSGVERQCTRERDAFRHAAGKLGGGVPWSVARIPTISSLTRAISRKRRGDS